MWPNGRNAAISITYDDGHPSQLDVAIPALEALGFRGTFFVTPGIYNVQERAKDWQRAAMNGHEIANHTWDHACDRLPLFDEVTFAAEETGKTEQWLNDNIGFDDLRTYAYICGVTTLGSEPGAQERYLNLVRATFWAARAGGGGPTSVAEVKAQPHLIPAQALTYNNNQPQPSIDYCNAALRSSGWAILIFHYLVSDGTVPIATETTESVHASILDHIGGHADEFWVAPFRDVYRYIQSEE